MFKFLLYKLGQFLVNFLPPQTAYTIAQFISDMQCRFSFRDRRAVYNNLSVIVDSQANLDTLTRDVFRNFGIYLTDFFRMRKMVNQEFFKKRVRLHDLSYIDDVLKEGRGGILLTAHIGNWELGGVMTAMQGYSIMAVALPHKERPVNDLFNHQREVKGITIVPIKYAVRRCMETLKKNELVALVADRDFNMQGELLPFLGRKAIIPRGPAVLSLRTGAPIIPAFCIRSADGTFDLTMCEPIRPPQDKIGSDHPRDMIELTGRYLPIVESYIKKYPSQWLMFRKFWVE